MIGSLGQVKLFHDINESVIFCVQSSAHSFALERNDLK